MSDSLWVEKAVLVHIHEIWGTDAFSMRYRFSFLVLTHIANTGLQGAIRGTGLVIVIIRFRHCLWNFTTKYINYDIDLTLSSTNSGFQILLNHGQHSVRWWLLSCSIQSHYLNRCFESRLVPLDTLGNGLSVNIVYGTWTCGVLLGAISIGIDE